jgi:hypothetical protein
MTLTKPKILALLLAAAYIAFCCHQKGATACLNALLQVAPGLALICFADLLGDAIGPTGRGQVTQSTPAILITLAGWIALVVLPSIAHLSLAFLLR